jgi:hypothetical protein
MLTFRPLTMKTSLRAARASNYLSRLILFLAWATFLPLALPSLGGSILREVFSGIGGNSLADLTNSPAFPNSPTSTNFVTDLFEAPTDVEESYGQRMHGYIVPPTTGSYTFWISSDDEGALYLSTDENPVRSRLIANVPGWTGSRQWGNYAEQQSAPITLQAGKAYYVAALMKEGGGGDNLAVRWVRPGGIDEGPIPATYLLPWGTAFTVPSITQQPTNTTVVEGQLATFVIKVSNLDSVTYLWRRNGNSLPASTSGVLEYGPVTLDDQGAQFGATVTNRIGATNSTLGTLTVLPDTTRPTVVSAISLGADRIRLQFSEPMDAASAGVTGNFLVNGGVTVTGAVLDSDANAILLTVAGMNFAQNYTVTISNLRDRARTPNTITANSTVSFLALELTAQNIGGGTGGIQRIGPGAFDLTGQGRGVSGGNDQFQLSWERRTGDFDLQVRMTDLGISSAFLRAGLMVRPTLDTNSAFAAVFGSSAQLGVFFESRASAGANPSQQTVVGGYPANYPFQWLRLRRAGNVFTGFGSRDGLGWTQLGSATLALPSQTFVGLAVASQNAAVASTVKFREYGPTASTAVAAFVNDRESPTPSSRRTGLTLSEIMYRPKTAAGATNNLEFVELFNAGAIFQEMTGWKLTGGIEYTFPAGSRIEAGQYVVVAADPAALQAARGLSGVLGPFSGSLNNAGDMVQLRDNLGAVKLEVDYSPDAPWPVAADGAGPSLVLTSPSYGEASPQAWTASSLIGGSPGMPDPVISTPGDTVVINEFLAHTDDPQLDFIELFNRSNNPADLSGCFLTDDPATNKFRVPAGTTLAARGFLAFDQNQLGFRLGAAGETIYLVSANGLRVLDAIRFGGQENGVASGRLPNGSDTVRRLAAPTPGAANGEARAEAIVLNEIMYNPISGLDDDEYVELHNRGAVAVDLAGWRFESGLDFRFPAGASLAPGGYVVVARNAARLLTNYPQLNAANTFGNFAGSLRNSGERIALSRPDDVVSTNELGNLVTNVIRIVVADVTYSTGGAWGRWSDGGGSSLELRDADSDPLRGANWADSDETQKAQWSEVSFTGRLDNGDGGQTANRLFLGLLNDGECLVDNVEVFQGAGTNLVSNPGFESGTTGWSFFGNHAQSGVDSAGAFAGTRCLRIRAGGGLDTGPNSIRTSLGSALANNSTATFRARVRWLRGWPELLFRLKGNYLDFAAALPVPANLGTPGQANSRAVANAGPAIYDVTHTPAIPRNNEAVLVTARVSDPDGITTLNLRLRLDPATSLTTTAMRDDGTLGDALAGDGVFTARITGRSAGTLGAFRIEAADGLGATAVFPARVPTEEALIRWGDEIPFGTFPHARLWTTQANQGPADGNGLNNFLRPCTIVYGNRRVIYGAAYRDKGSPFHGGRGDLTASLPDDDLLHGVRERLFSQTGNGGSEETGLRGRLAYWLGQQLEIPSLNGNPLHFFFNGGRYANIVEDLEEPDHRYAEQHYPEGGEGDLYKISIWFEFDDNNGGFNANQATLGRFLTTGSQLKQARYRWNWERRARQVPESDYTTIFDLVNAANNTATGDAFVQRMLTHGDLDQWMRVFAYNRIMGNWDAWTFGVGQNMYLYRQPGRPAVIMPWDLDFIFGLGEGAGGGLWGGQDPVANSKFNDNPAFRRMLWRAYIDAVNGPMLPGRFQPVIDALRAAQLANNIQGLNSTAGITTYINARRTSILGQINAANVAALAITSNGGNNFTSATASATITGTAPLAVASIAVNGIRYPVVWTGFTTFSLTVPLTQQSNPLVLVGLDRKGNPLPGVTDSVTVTYNGAVPQPQEFVVLNEVHYNPAVPQTSFVELHNRHATTPFDLSGFVLSGVGYTFPAGSIIAPNSYLLLVGDRAAFGTAFGAGVPIFDEFPGRLDNDGETLRLVKPGATPELDQRITDVRYLDHAPWPTEADGKGSSLQLIDPAQDTWRVGNWGAMPTNAANRLTPGAVNANRATLAAFPAVWLNEVLPNNVDGGLDNAGDREPYVELYNSGPTAVDLSAFFLTDTYANLTQWPFPAGTTLAPGGFLTVWADGETAESTGAAPHTSFRLNPTNGSVALVRLQGPANAPAVMDYADYANQFPNRSVGLIPDGDVRGRRLVYFPTAGASNNPAVPAVNVVINEFMAQNTATITDPADGDFDDWIELHNAGSTTVDLAGFFLTDNLTNKTMFTIPSGYPIPAGGFLLVWADGETGQNLPANAGLHASFALARGGEQIGLYSPLGELIDGVTFGNQTNNVSLGRYPDASENPLVFFGEPSPGSANFIPGGNLPPMVTPLADLTAPEGVLLSLTVVASDPDAGQTLRFSLGADAPTGAAIDESTGRLTWTPSELQGPGSYLFTVRATDNGTPPRSGVARLNVAVTEANLAPVIGSLADQSVDEGAQLAFTLVATDPDFPANTLTYALEPGAPAGASINPVTGEFAWTPTEDQGPRVFDVAFRVTDNGSPALSATKSIKVTVNEVNNPPSLTQPSPQSVDEGATLSLTLVGADPEGAAVRYSLTGNVPAGLALDETTGVLTWTPAEEQGPGSYPLVVKVTEQTAQQLSVQRTFSVTVNEANQAPVLGNLGDFTVSEGNPIAFVATATDADLPAQTLTYALVGDVPAGATLDANTGAFAWTTDEDAGMSTNVISVRVSDNGPGNLSDTKTFTVLIRPRFKVAINEIMYRPRTNNAEYIEVANASARTAWDISGYRLEGDELTFTFPANTVLAPGQHLCVVRNLAVFRATYGAALPVAGVWTGILGSTGDRLQLSPGDPTANPVAQVQFRSTLPWPAVAAGGAALQLIDGRRDNFRVGNWAAAPAYDGPRELAVMTNQWRYYQAGPPDPAWKENAFNDASWTVGRGLFFVETAQLPAPKTTPLTLGQSGYYFRTRFTLPFVPAGATLQLNHVVDDGAVFYLNGRELHRFGFGPDVVVQHDTPCTLVADATLVGPISLPAALLQAGENVFAVEAHQSGPGSSDIVFGASLRLEGGSVPGQTPGTTNNVGASLAAYPALYLNELLPNNTAGLADSKGEREPWVELHNAGPYSADLTGWGLTDSYTNLAKWTFPAGTTLGPDQFLVVFLDGEIGDATATELHTGFRAVAANGSLALVRPQGAALAVVDYLDYATVAANSSLASLPDGQPFAREVTTSPTPGADNNGTPPNRAPVLNPIAAQGGPEGVELTFIATASDPDAGQALAFSLEGAVPTGAILTPAGVFTWTPTEVQGPGSYPITVVVTDNGSPALSARQTVQFTITETNAAPILDVTTDKVLAEGQALNAQFTATDSDLPVNTLTYALVAAPEGMTINPATGEVKWTPGEAQGPAAYTVTVRVTDNGSPAASVERSFELTVTEVNVAPTLAGPGSATIPPLQPWIGQFTGADSDLPANTLTYALANSPGGMTINAVTGEVTWTPQAIQSPGTYPVTVRVSDGANPPGTAEHSLTLTVADLSSAPTPKPEVRADGTVALRWDTVAGVTYRVEVADGPAGPWQPLATVVGDGQPTTVTDNPGARSERYYRNVIP